MEIDIEKAGLSAKRAKILAALLQSPTYREAAAMAGVSESTVARCMQDATFKGIYSDCLKELLQDAAAASKKSMSLAISTLYEVCKDGEESGQTRVAAARAILEYGLKLTEAADLDARVAALEERANEEESGSAY